MAQTNTFPSTGSAGVGTTTPTQPLDVTGRIVTTGSQTLASTSDSMLEVKTTITNNGLGQSAIKARNIFNGSGDYVTGLDIAPTFAPSQSINTAQGFVVAGFFGPPAGVTITNVFGGSSAVLYTNVSGAVTNGTTFNIGSPYVYGALKPTTQYGLHVANQGISGTTNSYGLYVDSQSGSTNNYSAIFAGGNVGIGTTTPGYKLDVSGTINATGLNISGSPIAGSVFGRTGAVVQATNDYTWAQIDKGTSSLGDLATRACANLSNAAAFCSGTDAANLTGTVGAARLGSGTADNTTFLRGDNTWTVPSGATQWTTTGSNINYATSGNVGIGTGTPTYKLHVTGDGRFTGNLTVDGNLAAKYQDLAEWVPSSEQLPAGTVVVLDSTKSNQVIASSVSYDTRVAGVISEQPGIALGERGANKVLVATTGRVRVKVDASAGPIHVGDLLVTSDISGLAMKSEAVNIGGIQLHRPGTLIGKALEPLAKGQGTILVLLSLQ